MTIQAAPSEQSYATDGVSTVFAIPFPFDTAADLKLTSTDSAGNILTLTTGFTISGGGGSTGNATFSPAPVAGLTLTIYDDPARTQPTNYVSLDAFPAESHEKALDRVTRIAKRLYQLLQRSVRFPDGDVSTDGVLGSVANRKGKYLFFNAVTGAIEYALNIVTTTLSQSIIAQLLNPQTALEAAAAVVPTNYAYSPGHPLRYGAIGDGVADDTTALTNLLKTGHRVLGGGPQYIYRYTTTIAIPATVTSILADWQGATLKPTGASAPLIGNVNPVSAATTTLTAAPTIGAVVVTVTSVTGLVVGQVFWISCASYPAYFGRIKVIAGTTITLDTAAPVAYAGTVNFTVYTTFVQRIDWRNFRFDGSALTAANAALGQCMRWVGAKVVSLANGEYANFALPAAVSTVVLCEAFFCAQVDITSQWIHDSPLAVSAVSGSAATIEVDECGQVSVSGNLIESDSFGINITRCTQARASGNILRGQRFWATATSSALASVRGIKITACAVAKWIDNDICDYVTPIKGDLGFQIIVIGNVIRNVPGTGTTGTLYTDSAIEIQPGAGDTNTHGILIHGNVIENVNGHGIGLSDNNGSNTALIQAQVIGNRIKGTKGFAVNFIGKDVAIIGNHIEDWDLAIVGTAALGNSGGGLGSGATIRDNLYIHNSDVTRPLLQGQGNAGYIYVVDGNKSPTGNPLLGTSANGFQAQGTGSVLTGTTSIAIVFTNPLFRAPAAGEIFITPTLQSSNPPGQWWVSAILNTGFTLNVAANPGANGFPFGYQARITQPYTV